MGKRGPQVNWALDPNGRPVDGLVLLPSSGRYVAADDRNKTFGRDRDEAIRKFLAWLADRQAATVPVTIATASMDNDQQIVDAFHTAVEMADEVADGIGGAVKDGKLTLTLPISERAYIDRVRHDLQHNRDMLAVKTGFHQIAHLDDVEPTESATLASIAKRYFDDKKGTIRPNTWKDSKSYWDEFIAITKAKTVSDLSHEAFRAYRDRILTTYRERDLSNQWVSNKFRAVKAIINWSIVEMSTKELPLKDRQILSCMSLLKSLPGDPVNPVVITPQEFKAVLKKADAYDKALFLFGMNSNWDPKDVVGVTWGEIDMKTGHVARDRTKTEWQTGESTVRVCVLWKRTITALRKLGIGKPSERVFGVTGRDVPNNRFQRLLEAAGITRELVFHNFRHSGDTIMAEKGIAEQQQRVVAGRTFDGCDDHYIRRHPEFVTAAMQAIEQYYFGAKASQKPPKTH